MKIGDHVTFHNTMDNVLKCEGIIWEFNGDLSYLLIAKCYKGDDRSALKRFNLTLGLQFSWWCTYRYRLTVMDPSQWELIQ